MQVHACASSISERFKTVPSARASLRQCLLERMVCRHRLNRPLDG